jgi:hypothetical protein
MGGLESPDPFLRRGDLEGLGGLDPKGLDNGFHLQPPQGALLYQLRRPRATRRSRRGRSGGRQRNSQFLILNSHPPSIQILGRPCGNSKLRTEN